MIDFLVLWSITEISVIVLQECRDILRLIVEKDAFMMAVCD